MNGGEVLLRIQLPQEGGGEGGEEMGYRGEERGGEKVEAEGKTINQEAWSPRGWRPTSPVPITVSWSSHQAPTPSASHMFWNLSPLRGGVGGGHGGSLCLAQAGGCFLSCWSRLHRVRGSSCPRPLECARGAETPRQGGHGVAAHPGPVNYPPPVPLEGGGQQPESRTARCGDRGQGKEGRVGGSGEWCPAHLPSDSRAQGEAQGPSGQ